MKTRILILLSCLGTMLCVGAATPPTNAVTPFTFSITVDPTNGTLRGPTNSLYANFTNDDGTVLITFLSGGRIRLRAISSGGTNGGTVTSVAVTNTDGFLSLSGSPILSNGTITLNIDTNQIAARALLVASSNALAAATTAATNAIFTAATNEAAARVAAASNALAAAITAATNAIFTAGTNDGAARVAAASNALAAATTAATNAIFTAASNNAAIRVAALSNALGSAAFQPVTAFVQSLTNTGASNLTLLGADILAGSLTGVGSASVGGLSNFTGTNVFGRNFIENVTTNNLNPNTASTNLNAAQSDWFTWTLSSNTILVITNWFRSATNGQTISLTVSNPSTYSLHITNDYNGRPMQWMAAGRVTLQPSPSSTTLYVFQIFGSNWVAGASTNL